MFVPSRQDSGGSGDGRASWQALPRMPVVWRSPSTSEVWGLLLVWARLCYLVEHGFVPMPIARLPSCTDSAHGVLLGRY